jgi:hypothetical protein
MTKDEVLAQAMQLQPAERNELAEQLRQSVLQGEFSAEDIVEFRRRATAVDRGEAKTHDGEQVMRELFERLRVAKAG